MTNIKTIYAPTLPDLLSAVCILVEDIQATQFAVSWSKVEEKWEVSFPEPKEERAE